MNGVVFDTGALIAFERGTRGLVVLVTEARHAGETITVPAGCVAQAWRKPERQARLAALLRQPNVRIVALDAEDARRIGLLLATTGTRDVIDAHVALCAHRLGHAVLTSDTDDIRRLVPNAVIQQV